MKELALHVLDIAQNSISARSTLIEISVTEDLIEDKLIIQVKDNGCGMTPELLDNVADPFITTRTSRKVGLGIPFLKQAAIECNGDLWIRSIPREGTLLTAEFQYSHIDRMPLGNIVDTIATLLIGNDSFDLVYRHQVNGNECVLDTREIKDAIQDVPLDHPEVIQWVRDTLNHEINELTMNRKE